MKIEIHGHAERVAGSSIALLQISLLGSALLGSSCRNDPAEERVRALDAGSQPSSSRSGTAGRRGGSEGTSGSMRDGGRDDDSGTVSAGMDAGMDAMVLTPEFTIPNLLAAVGQCAIGRYAEFEQRASDLRDATDTLAADSTAENRAAAQVAYRKAMASWQRAELFHIGPAARTPAPGAQNLRDQIYFFPGSNFCLVDQQIVSQRYAEDDFATSFANARGLSALEYLLFHDGPENACGGAIGINSSGSWAALSMSELTQRRADYAHAAAADVLARATALRQAWEPAGGNFVAQLSAPGSDSVYATEQAALEAIIAALFYADEELKDLKLGTPLGLTEQCASSPVPCPDATESRYARLSAEHIRENLVGFRMIFEGCGASYGGVGVDDWLRTKDDGQDLAERMLAALDGAEAAVSGLNAKLEDAILEVPPDEVSAVHAAIKVITDLFKTEMVTVLMVSLPASGQGDND